MADKPYYSASPMGGGMPGKDGKSAYEIAKDEGYKGSEKEWLKTLEGSEGKDGQDGINGTDGDDGKDGKDGFPTEEQWNALKERVDALEGGDSDE